METQYLKTFMAVIETASFSKAAAELCITQSAVSQRIKFMEERYGHQLIDRSSSHLVATEAGRVVLDKADRILLIEREIHKELAKITGNRRLSICCTPTFGIVYLPQALSSFLLKCSEAVDLKFIFLTPDQAVKGLSENEYDLAVIEHCEEINYSEFTTFSLPKDELVFISSSKAPLVSKKLRIEDIFHMRLITRKEGCSSRRLLEMNLLNIGCSLNDFNSLVVFDDLRLIIQSVISGGGTAFVSRSLVQAQIDEGSLQAHEVAGFCQTRHRTVLINRNRGVPELIESFLESLNTVFCPK